MEIPRKIDPKYLNLGRAVGAVLVGAAIAVSAPSEANAQTIPGIGTVLDRYPECRQADPNTYHVTQYLDEQGQVRYDSVNMGPHRNQCENPDFPDPLYSDTLEAKNIDVSGLVRSDKIVMKCPDGSRGFALVYSKPTQGEGFAVSTGGLNPIYSTEIDTRLYISPKKEEGLHAGSAMLKCDDRFGYSLPTKFQRFRITLLKTFQAIASRNIE